MEIMNQNRITELFGIKYPIIQAGMVWASGWRLASAVSNAGGLGLIGAGSMYPEVLREHIQKGDFSRVGMSTKPAQHITFGRHHKGFDDVPAFGVRFADNSGFQNCGMFDQTAFHVEGTDAISGR